MGYRKNIETAIILVNFICLVLSLIIKDKQTDYTPYSKFLFHTYMIGLLGLCLLSCLFKANFITKQIGIFNTGKGKGIILLIVGLVYITGNSMILFILGIVLSCSAAALIVMDIFIPCETKPTNANVNPNLMKGEQGVTPSTEQKKEIDQNNPYCVPDDF